MKKIIHCTEATQKIALLKEQEKELVLSLEVSTSIHQSPEKKQAALLRSQELLSLLHEETKIFHQEIFWSWIERSREAIGNENFIGPEEINQFIPIDFEHVPKIPYSREELKKAQSEGMMLILRMDTDKNGRELTAAVLNEILSPQMVVRSKLFTKIDNYKTQPYFTTDVPKLQWRLVSKCIVPHSYNTDYIDQTRILRDMAQAHGILTPVEAGECSDELLDSLSILSGTRFAAKAAQELVSLKVNKNYRATFVESIWDSVFTHLIHKKNIENYIICTSSCSNTDQLVFIYETSDGFLVGTSTPDSKDPLMGAIFCR